MPFIIIITIGIYLILIAWLWKNLANREPIKKIGIIMISILVMYLITLFVFSIAKNGIMYDKEAMVKNVQTILVFLFTGVNGLLVLPIIAKIEEQIEEKELDKKTGRRRIVSIIIIFIIFLIFECGYLNKTQKGILEIYRAMK